MGLDTFDLDLEVHDVVLGVADVAAGVVQTEAVDGELAQNPVLQDGHPAGVRQLLPVPLPEDLGVGAGHLAVQDQGLARTALHHARHLPQTHEANGRLCGEDVVIVVSKAFKICKISLF